MQSDHRVADGRRAVKITARITAAAVLLPVLLAAVAAGIGCGGEQPSTLDELKALGKSEHKRVLLEGIAEGRLLYSKHEQYQREPGGDLPQRFVSEIWQGVGPDGKFDRSVSRLWYEDGPETMDMVAGMGHHSLAAWLEQVWNLPEFLEVAGFELKGHGTLRGMESVIYELESESRLERIEIAADAPLIARHSTYEIVGNGDLVLVSQNAMLDYALLPPGSEPPTADMQ